MENEKIENKEQVTQTTETPKKVHGNKGKKKNFTPEQLENKKKKMREAWAKKKATQTTN